MPSREKLGDQVKILTKERGSDALEFSKQYMLQEEIEYTPFREAVLYFIEEIWFDLIHPSLISLACEAVGGNPKDTTKMGAAIVLIAGAADIHDDVLDQSAVKGSKQTVFGKFGSDIAVLTGDAFLLKGIYLLYNACESLTKEQKEEILGIVRRTFFEASSGVAREASFRGKTDISLADFLDYAKQKVSTAEATARIGAIMGKGTCKEIDAMGNYGRTLGFLLSLREEFVDVFKINELRNRWEHEILPIPVLLALKNSSVQSELLGLLRGEITDYSRERILDLSLGCGESRKLFADMKRIVKKGIAEIRSVRDCKDALILLLQTTLEDL